MNGYQSYLKRTPKIIELEVMTARKLGYNLGIKLVRGAYMNEERQVAKEQGYESPVQDTIDDTHASYNRNLKHVIENLEGDDCLFVASHNNDSVELAKNMMSARPGLKEKNVRFG